MRRSILLLPFAAACSLAAAPNTFDTAADLTDNFNQTTSAGSVWGHSGTGGNPDGYATSTVHNGYNTSKTSFVLDTSADRSFTVSTDFLTVGGQSTTDRRSLTHGVATSDSVSYESGGYLAETSISVGLYTDSHDNDDGGDGDGTSTNFRYFAGTNNPDAVNNLSVGSNDDLDHATWYHLETNWTYTQADDTFDVEVVVKNADKTATLRTIPIGSNIANPFGPNPTLHVFFGGRDSFDSGIGGVDNYEVTPPPAIPGNVALVPAAGNTATANFTLQTTDDLNNSFSTVPGADIVSVTENSGVISAEFNNGSATNLFLQTIGSRVFENVRIDFNGGNELATDFDGYLSGTQFTQPATGGINNSSWISTATASSNIAVNQNESFDASSFSGATIGIFFQFDSVGTTFNQRPLSVGFTQDTANTYKSSSENDVSSSDNTTASDIRVQLVGGGGEGGTTAAIRLTADGSEIAQSSVDITMTQNNWYYLELRIGGVSGGDFTGVEGQLFDASSDGTIGASLKNLNSGGSGYTVTCGLTSDSDAYAFFGGFSPGNAIAGVDNLIVSQPGTGGASGDTALGSTSLVAGATTATVSFTLETAIDPQGPYTAVDSADILSVTQSGDAISVEFDAGDTSEAFLRVNSN